MAEWLFEAGIGEDRAALVEDGAIVEAHIDLHDSAPRVGAVLRARLADRATGRLVLPDGTEALLAHMPAGTTEGATLTVAIVREPIPEPGRAKLPRAIATEAPEAPAPTLLARITATGIPVRTPRAHEADALEAAGWSELLEEAENGEIAFPGGALRMTPTPAMTLFDVDGTGPLDVLAVCAATATAHAIRRHGIAGSIGIDFPTLANKAQRQAVADAIDAAMVGAFERTAMNGFGFLQIVRRRERASLPELLHADRIGAAARAELRRMERLSSPLPATHIVPKAVADRIAAHPEWIATLTRRIGGCPEILCAPK